MYRSVTPLMCRRGTADRAVSVTQTVPEGLTSGACLSRSNRVFPNRNCPGGSASELRFCRVALDARQGRLRG
jgi:hypothetical protein